MAFPLTDTMIKSAEDDFVQCEEEEDVNVDAEIGETPLRYVPLCEVYSATTPCVTVSGSKKVKPPNRKHNQIVHRFNGQDHPKPVHSNGVLSKPLPITRVYTRRRRRKPSFSGTLIVRSNSANSDSFVVKEKVEEEVIEVEEIGNALDSDRKKKEEKRKKGKSATSLNSVEGDNVNVEEIEVCKTISSKKKEKRKRDIIVISENSESGEDRVFEEEVGEDNSIVEKKKRRMAPDEHSEKFEGDEEELHAEGSSKSSKKKKLGNYELAKLGVNSDTLKGLGGLRLRETRMQPKNSDSKLSKKKQKSSDGLENQMRPKNFGSTRAKRWVWLQFDGVDPRKFIGLQCKVYWPLDADWYSGRVIDYSSESGRHQVEYEDGDKELLILENERIKFYISAEEMQCLKLSCSDKSSDANGPDVNELVVLAASLDDCQDFEPEDILWAKLTGHAMWPAIVLDDSLCQRKGLDKVSGEKSFLVQFFGTHDFARVKKKQVIPFLRGLLSSFHQKCKRSNFIRSLEEAKMYLSEQRIPKRMLRLRRSLNPDNYDSENEEKGIVDSDEECMGNDVGEGGLDSTSRLIDLKKTLNSKKVSKLVSLRHQDLPAGYRAVHVKWKDLDKCNVCHMDEEYENNLFLQCGKCRMMVHARCYGELEPVDGAVWLCNLCRAGAPDVPPPCCLCPFIGGAMKPTTDGRWAHLACAIWIPETCLSDVKRMEPIDGLSRINKDRWKLLCSICGVSYGACIQCSNNSCRVAYHPLCARAAGFCVELEDEDRLHLMSFEEDEENQCIRLLSFCKRHRPLSKDRVVVDERIAQQACENRDYAPPSNLSGCARSEPYNYAGRRGRKEPEALAAVSLKRLYVENMPYLVGGHSQHGPLWNTPPANAFADSKTLVGLRNMSNSQLGESTSILSVAEKYKHMRESFRKRLAFGKSRIHGFGIFAKLPHRAGDMVIEYTGELVRPPVADRREHLIYNSLVGAGTYMFRINDERVIDATRAGSIAHLINHSCEPNCYSRVISVNGDEHIIIFAKRDIKQWEELSYDYRFFSIDEQLACYCGFPRCRGVVNDTEAEERAVKVHALPDELMDWQGD